MILYTHSVFEILITDFLASIITIEQGSTSILVIVNNCGSFIAMSIEVNNMSAPWGRNIWPFSIWSQPKQCTCCISNPRTSSFCRCLHLFKVCINWGWPGTIPQCIKLLSHHYPQHSNRKTVHTYFSTESVVQSPKHSYQILLKTFLIYSEQCLFTQSWRVLLSKWA